MKNNLDHHLSKQHPNAGQNMQHLFDMKWSVHWNLGAQDLNGSQNWSLYKKWGAKPDFYQAGLKISNYNLSGHRYQKKLTGPPQGRNHRKHFTIIYDLNYRPTSNAVVLCYLIAVQKVVFQFSV